MNSYQYKAIDRSGRLVKGRISAADERNVEEELNRRGLSLIDSSIPRRGLGRRDSSAGRVSPAVLVEFYRRFAQAFEIGLPVLTSLEEIGRHLPSRTLKLIVQEVHFAVEGGKGLAEAMGRHPRVFSPLDLAMVGMGEKTGGLPKCLRDLAAYHEWKAGIGSVVKKAALYPAFILVAILAVIGVWIGHVLPQMVTVMTEMGVTLPAVTMALLALSGFTREQWPFLLGGFFLTAAGFWLWGRTERGRMALDRRLLRLPVVGRIARNIALARFCNNFSAMLAAGMNIHTAFTILSDRILGNRHLEQRLRQAHLEVERGETISGAFEKAGGFPLLLLGAIRTGETTGTLEDALRRMGDYYDQEVKRTVQVMVGTIEPVAILSLGAVFGLIVLSILLPLYDVMGQMGKAY